MKKSPNFLQKIGKNLLTNNKISANICERSRECGKKQNFEKKNQEFSKKFLTTGEVCDRMSKFAAADGMYLVN